MRHKHNLINHLRVSYILYDSCALSLDIVFLSLLFESTIMEEILRHSLMLVVFARSFVEMCILSPVHFRSKCIIKVFQMNSSKSGSQHAF